MGIRGGATEQENVKRLEASVVVSSEGLRELQHNTGYLGDAGLAWRNRVVEASTVYMPK